MYFGFIVTFLTVFMFNRFINTLYFFQVLNNNFVLSASVHM